MWQEQVSIRCECRTCGRTFRLAAVCQIGAKFSGREGNMSTAGAKSSGKAKPSDQVIDAPFVASRATRSLSAQFIESKCSPCVRRGHLRGACKSAGKSQLVERSDIPEASQDKADVGEV